MKLGERCVEIALKEVGVAEDPPGSNSGPRVCDYLAGCERGDNGTKLHLRASNWCMAFQSWCCYRALYSTETPPHGWRAGVVEAVADARDPQRHWTGRWKPVADARSGIWVPNVGDLAIWDRSDPSKPETSWYRHVNRVVQFDSDGLFTTVGGNEMDRVRIGQQTIQSAKLLGFIAYPQLDGPPATDMLSDAERREMQNQVAISLDGILRESLWDDKSRG